MKISILNNIAQEALDQINSQYVTEESIQNPDGILLRSTDLHETEFGDQLKFIGRAGSGVNNIPVEKCSEQGIVVTNAPRANANGVKELVIFSMVFASRNISEAIKWTNQLKGEENIPEKIETGKKKFVGTELRGKKVGVIGLGSIGGNVANMCDEFGMEVYGFDPYLTTRTAWGIHSSVKRVEKLDTLFEKCDFVTLHVPYNEENHHLINAKLLKKAKEGLIVINVARDGLVDLKALKHAIELEKVDQYVVDFPEEETLKLPKTVNIPHLGASTHESQVNAASMVVDQLNDYLENGNITNSVNFPETQMGVCKSEARLAIHHRNQPNMLNQIIELLGKNEINIAYLNNNHKDKWAYTMVDADSTIDESIIEKVKAIDGVVRVRLIKGNK